VSLQYVPKPSFIVALTVEYLLGDMLKRAVTSRDFPLLNDEDFLFTEHGHGKLFGESLSEQLSDGCQMVVRLVVKGLLSEGFCQSDR
jgi:hypothetical protein